MYLVLYLCLLTPQQTEPVKPVDTSDKRCVVTEVVREGVRSDCGAWRPAKGERLFMPAKVSQQLKVGDTFYFVWQETRWVAALQPTVAVALTPQQSSVNCTVVNLSPLSVVCAEGSQQVELRGIEWPSEWGKGAFLTGVYRAEIRDGKVFPLFTAEDPARDRDIYERSLAEQRRWRRHPAQLSERRPASGDE